MHEHEWILSRGGGGRHLSLNARRLQSARRGESGLAGEELSGRLQELAVVAALNESFARRGEDGAGGHHAPVALGEVGDGRRRIRIDVDVGPGRVVGRAVHVRTEELEVVEVQGAVGGCQLEQGGVLDEGHVTAALGQAEHGAQRPRVRVLVRAEVGADLALAQFARRCWIVAFF